MKKKRLSRVKNMLILFQSNTVLLYCYSSVRNKSVCKFIQQNVLSKGQLISKANCQVVDSPKNRTDGSGFFAVKSSYVAKSKAVCSFFGRIFGMAPAPICFQFNLTFSDYQC